MMAYVTYMTQRMLEMHRVLKSTGNIYLHCDPTASHYLKIVMDRLFGKENFRNEIIWSCQTGGVSKRWFGRKHDVALFYSKTDDYRIALHRVKEKRSKDFIHRTDVPVRTDVVVERANDKSVKERLFKDQGGRCNGCGASMNKHHLEVDHIVPKSKGGGDYYENYQLLCGHCNRTKGDRPMEYLHAKIVAREALLKKSITFGGKPQ